MFSGDCPAPILILPSEILKKVLNNLSYSFLQSIRPTCKAFDSAASELLYEGVHSVRLRADNATVQFLKATWLKTNHAGVAAVMTYAKRLAKGAGSLVILAGLIRAVDVCSRHLVRVGALPPLPGSVLDEIFTAVNIASRRNPLVGITRLQCIYQNLLLYFRHNRVLVGKDIPPAVMFRTVWDVLQNMPRLVTSNHLEQTDEGIRLYCTLPPIRIQLQPPDGGYFSKTNELLHKLVQLSMQVVDGHILTSQAGKVMGYDSVSEHEGYITGIQLSVPGEGMQHLSLYSLRQLEPPVFFVTISGFKLTSPIHLEDLEDREQISLFYCTVSDGLLV